MGCLVLRRDSGWISGAVDIAILRHDIVSEGATIMIISTAMTLAFVGRLAWVDLDHLGCFL